MIYYDSNLHVPVVSDDKISYFCQISLETIILMSDIYIWIVEIMKSFLYTHPPFLFLILINSCQCWTLITDLYSWPGLI
jgi:hypothetical protein